MPVAAARARFSHDRRTSAPPAHLRHSTLPAASSADDRAGRPRTNRSPPTLHHRAPPARAARWHQSPPSPPVHHRTIRNRQPTTQNHLDRKSGVQGKRVSVRVDLGVRRIIKKNKKNKT